MRQGGVVSLRQLVLVGELRREERVTDIGAVEGIRATARIAFGQWR